MDSESGCLVIAEVAQSHDGSLGMAHSFIDAASKAGANAVKFQMHIAAEESTPSEPWRVKFSPQDATRYEYWERMEFTGEQWIGLREHAHRAGIKFICSPFSLAAVDLLKRVGVDGWKVASGEVSNWQMLDAIAAAGGPIFLSSGMSSWAELDEAVGRLKEGASDLVVMQCTSEYPCPPTKIGLNLITEIRDRYRCKVGLSDHSGAIYAGLAAATMRIFALEVHVTFSRAMYGPDVPASVTFEELRQLVDGIRFIETAVAFKIDKDRVAAEKSELRNIFGKSVVAASDLPAGAVLREVDLALRKPGTGIPAKQWNQVIGRRLIRAVTRNHPIAFDDIE